MTEYNGNFALAHGNVAWFASMVGYTRSWPDFASPATQFVSLEPAGAYGQAVMYTAAFGYGFAYDPANPEFQVVTAGTITTLEEWTYGGQTFPLALGTIGSGLNPLNISASAYWNASPAARFNMVFFGDDIINGGANDDVLGGGIGADQINGAGGTDTMSFQFANSGIGVNLSDLSQNFGEAFGDTYTSIEKYLGTAYDDSFTGGSGDDEFDGADGDDTFVGGAGNDKYNGSGGAHDRLDYSGASEAVNVALDADGNGTGLFFQGFGTDTFTGIEDLTGGGLNDNLTGNASANRLVGNAGQDTLDGGGGADALLGGIGDDTYYLRSGLETLTEESGEGTDTILFNIANFAVGPLYLPENIYHLADNIENLTNQTADPLAVMGNGLNNVITGGSGTEVLYGGIGTDTLIGGGGSNYLVGGAGGDILDGSIGLADYASYIDAAQGVVLRFSLGYLPIVNTSGDAVGDTYIGIEGIQLSTHADILIGGAGGLANLRAVLGDAGNDIFVTGAAVAGGTSYDGGADNDTLYFGNVSAGWNNFNGDSGNDTASFLFISDFGVTVNMALTYTETNYFTVLCSGQDQRLWNVENIEGSQQGDTITGDSADNILKGLGGADTIGGGAGHDQLFGGDGDDTIIYDAADDLANVLGGNNFDTLRVVNQAVPLTFDLATHQFERANVITDDSTGQWWSNTSDYYNASWQRTNSDIRADDGRLVQTTFDVSPGGTAQSWQFITDYRNASNVLTNQDGKFDNGTLFSKSFDYAAGTATDGISDELREFTYFFRNDAEKAANIVANVEGFYDDGRKFTQTNDIDLLHPWLFQTNWYKTDGVTLDYQETRWDDGHTTIVPY